MNTIPTRINRVRTWAWAPLVVVVLLTSACGREALVDETTTGSPVQTTAESTTTSTTVDEAPEPVFPGVTTLFNEEEAPVQDEVETVETTVDQSSTTSAPTTSTTTTTLPPQQVWVDLPDAAYIRIDAINAYAQMEITDRNGVEYFPEGPNVGVVNDPDTVAGPCELGTSWLVAHAHTTGATPWMVVQEGDVADQRAREINHPGIQIGDEIIFELVDGTTCTYEVAEFPRDSNIFSGVPARSIGETPLMTWPKDRFLATELPHPWQEWYTPTDEAVMYISTSGGWPQVIKANGRRGRPNADTLFAVLVESDHPPVFAD